MKNLVILIGNAGIDPEVKVFNDGGKIARFSLATSESWKNAAGEKQEHTEWHNVVVKGKLAELAVQYVKKGGKYCIQGKVGYRSYEKDGVNVYITEIIASELTFL